MSMFISRLARDGSIDPTAKALYAALASFVQEGTNPTRATLAACIGKSVKTVDRTTVVLEAAGLISVDRRIGPDFGPLPNVYHLLDTPDGAISSTNGKRNS